MVCRGKVQNGVVVLDKGAKLEEGEAVSVRRLRRRASRKGSLPTLYERLKPAFGALSGLPSDWARQHDHYIHGTPKRNMA